MKSFFNAVIYQPIYNLLAFFAWLVPGHSVGWSIILVTIVVRLALWKLSLKGITTPIMLGKYKDEIAELQERYKDDKAAQSQALLAFYKEKGVNPLSGCLPMLIQLPIIIILYRVFVTGLANYQPDLIYSFVPHMDTLNTQFFGLELTKADRYFLPILAGLAQFFQTKHLQALNPPPKNSTDPAAMMNKQMLFMFPAMTFFIAMSLPSGLALYWVVSALFSWGQQVYITKTFKPKTANVSVTVRSKSK